MIKKNNKRISHFRGKKSHFGKEKIYNSIGISLNALNYYGDLSPLPNRLSTDIGFTRPAIGFSFTHRFGPRYQIIGAFTYGGIRGSDAESADPKDDKSKHRYVRNLSFRNRIKELSIVGNLDLFENQSTYISRVAWTPYVYLGVAVFHHNPQAKVPSTDLNDQTFSNAGEWVNLKDYGTEGQNIGLGHKYKLIQISIPFGLGVRFRINEVMDFSSEIGFRYTFTDYLDDVGGNYFDLTKTADKLTQSLSYRSNEADLTSSQIDEQNGTFTYTNLNGSSVSVINGFGHENTNGIPNIRGGQKDKDIYTVTTFRLTYIIGKTFHRAKFR
ncbi:MAG: DUF6089 family protein [Flammeovirgaceae bacterium]|nr:DUF6089 family protein [Flammeovirgaceae bacterium]